MTTQAIIQRIRENDWSLVDQPGTIGPEAAAEIRPLLRDEDPEVRELAVHALAAAGGPQGRQGVLEALRNDSIMARSAACRCLEARPDPQDRPALAAEVASNGDEFVRRTAARVLGVIGDADTVDVLKRQIAVETDSTARDAMALALARLDEPEYRRRYLARLHHAEPAERARAAEDAPYVGPAVLGDLLPLLDDARDAVRAGPSDSARMLRVCDVAVNVLDTMLDHPFSFQTGRRIRYSTDQIDEARRLLRQGR